MRGHLDLPSLARSSSPLLSRLYTKGRLTQLSYGDTTVGSVAISEDFHPYDAEGRLQPHLSLLGVLTEGVRYFTHYLSVAAQPLAGGARCAALRGKHHRLIRSSGGRRVQRLVQVVDQIVHVLDPDGEPDRFRTNAGRRQLVRGELPMGGRRRMDGQ